MKRQRYEIRVEGHLSADWSDWFEGLAIRQEADGETTLSGPLDQAALHGALAKVRDLGLTLVAVTRINRDYRERPCHTVTPADQKRQQQSTGPQHSMRTVSSSWCWIPAATESCCVFCGRKPDGPSISTTERP